MEHFRLYDLIASCSYKTTGDSVDYLVMYDEVEKMIYLLFQCSNGKRDWQNNFCFPIRPYKQQENVLWYHGGFCRAWKSANDEIMDELLEVCKEHPDYEVTISGWSLGGAMAVCACEDFYYRSHKKSYLVTFGAPKVCFGKKTRATLLQSTKFTAQYRHVNDIVPYMPPFAGYTHVYDDWVGSGKSFWKLFNPNVYHCMYGDESIYNV